MKMNLCQCWNLDLTERYILPKRRLHTKMPLQNRPISNIDYVFASLDGGDAGDGSVTGDVTANIDHPWMTVLKLFYRGVQI